MTRKLLALLFLLLIVALSPSANAQNATTGSAQTAVDAASRLKEQMKLLQDQKKAAASQIKSETKAMIQAKRNEFKTRIQTIKDQKKKTLVERIDMKLAEVNKKHTSKFSETINKLQGLLDKIKQVAIDPNTSTNTLTAQAAIDSAKAAIDIQAAKTYTMTIGDDTTLKENAGTTVSRLRQDLSDLYKLVIDAKQVVQKLNTDRNLIRKEATGSANL